MKIVTRNFRYDILSELDGSIDIVIATLEKFNEEAKKEGYINIKLELERNSSCYSCDGDTVGIRGEREETQQEESKRVMLENKRAELERTRELGQLAHLKKKYE